MPRLFSLLFLILPLYLTAQQPKQYDILNLQADIIIKPYHGQVTGELVYQIKMLNNADRIRLDAPGIHTRKIKIGCFSKKYIQTDKLLIINNKFKKDRTYKLHIWYDAQPKKAMYFTGWHSNGRKQVWTQGQGKNNSHWLPTNDDQNDKFTWKLQITAPKGYQVISNGKKIKHRELKNKHTLTIFKQNLPAPAYLIFVGLGKYIETKFIAQSRTPVYNYQYADHTTNDKTYYKSKFIFDFLNTEIPVAYPWKNYKQIPCRDFLYGGMENVSATSFNGDRYVVDSIEFNDTNFVNVSAHELAHQWFGDMVTGKSSADHWLHEGFATYYARLVDSAIFGKAYNDYKVYRYDQQIIASQNTDTIPLHRPNASSLTYYQKGARIVQMLRQKIGNDAYLNLINMYLTRYMYENASIADFKKLTYEATGDSLPRFFHLWFETQNIPKFVVQQKGDSILFKQNSHHLDLDFLIMTQDTTYKIRQKKSFKIVDYQHIKTIITNPDNKNLYDIDYQRKKTWVQNQILYAPAFIDRYKALKQIRHWDESLKDSIYNVLLFQDAYYPVYAEILQQIKHDLNPKHIRFIQKLFQKALKTRQQIALQLDSIPVDIKASYKSLLHDASYVTKQAALWHYWVQFPDERSALLDQTQAIKGSNDKAFRLTWLSLALMTHHYKDVEKQRFAKELINYTSPDYNMLVRLNAFDMLLNIQLINKTVINNLLDAGLHFNWRMHQPARSYLKKLSQNGHFRDLIQTSVKKLPKDKQMFYEKLLFNHT